MTISRPTCTCGRWAAWPGPVILSMRSPTSPSQALNPGTISATGSPGPISASAPGALRLRRLSATLRPGSGRLHRRGPPRGNVIDSSGAHPQRERCGEITSCSACARPGASTARSTAGTTLWTLPRWRLGWSSSPPRGGRSGPGGPLALYPRGFLVSNQLIGDLLDRQEQANWEDLIVRPERGPRL